jgi:hypothetical protein
MHRILTYALDTTDLAPDLAQEIRGREVGRITNRVWEADADGRRFSKGPEQENGEKIEVSSLGQFREDSLC